MAAGNSSPPEIVFRGEAEIQDFYDQSGNWTGLIGKLKDGSIIEYHRL